MCTLLFYTILSHYQRQGKGLPLTSGRKVVPLSVVELLQSGGPLYTCVTPIIAVTVCFLI